MSNLFNSVNNQTASATGEITLSTSDISEFNITSPSNNECIQYVGSKWVSGGIPSISAASFDFTSYWRTNGVTYASQANYNTSFEQPFYLTARSRQTATVLMEKKDTSSAGLIGATRVINANAIFATGFSVDRATSKKALLICDLVISEASDSNAYIDVQWQNKSGDALGPIVRVHQQSEYNRNTVYGYIDTSSAVDDDDSTVGLKRLSSSGSLGYARSTDTRQNIIIFAKLVQ